MDEQHLRILIVRTDRIGDVVLTLPMAKVLRTRFPKAHIAMLIRRYTSELVEDYPGIDEILYYDDERGNLIPFFALVSVLRSKHFDIVFHTYPRFRLAVLTWFAGCPARVGTGYRWYSLFFNRKVYDHRKTAEFHELEYNIRLMDSVGFSSGQVDLYPVITIKPEAGMEVHKKLKANGIGDDDPIVLLHPGSGGSARDWSPLNFGLLAKRLASSHPDVRIVVTGGKGEQEIVDIVARAAGDGVVPFVDMLTLREYAALASRSKVFVGNSTGPLHIAAAAGTPIVGLYPQITALSAKRWGPYAKEKTIFTPVGKPVDCTVCLSKKAAQCECMDTIGVDDVCDAVINYLRQG